MKRSVGAMLAAYYYGTLPWRWWAGMRRSARATAPVMILFYHRVADEYPNSWTISNRLFERQVAWMRSRFDMVSLAEAQQRIRDGANCRPAVSITFDDGYADNCAFALPLLIRHGVPCTYFVSVDHIVTGAPFPHDVQAGQVLRPNTVEELWVLAHCGIEIGLHTRRHVDLGSVVDDMQLQDEIVQAGSDLANLVDRPIRFFAFPYGLHRNLSAKAFDVARTAGYQAVCSAYGGYNFPGDDPFHLQRFHADPEWIRWKNWLTVDPRKVRATRRFDYSVTQTDCDGEARSIPWPAPTVQGDERRRR